MLAIGWCHSWTWCIKATTERKFVRFSLYDYDTMCWRHCTRNQSHFKVILIQIIFFFDTCSCAVSHIYIVLVTHINTQRNQSRQSKLFIFKHTYAYARTDTRTHIHTVRFYPQICYDYDIMFKNQSHINVNSSFRDIHTPHTRTHVHKHARTHHIFSYTYT